MRHMNNLLPYSKWNVDSVKLTSVIMKLLLLMYDIILIFIYHITNFTKIFVILYEYIFYTYQVSFLFKSN